MVFVGGTGGLSPNGWGKINFSSNFILIPPTAFHHKYHPEYRKYPIALRLQIQENSCSNHACSCIFCLMSFPNDSKHYNYVLIIRMHYSLSFKSRVFLLHGWGRDISAGVKLYAPGDPFDRQGDLDSQVRAA